MSEVYISVQENNKQLVIQGELTLLERLLHVLRSNVKIDAERAKELSATQQETRRSEA